MLKFGVIGTGAIASQFVREAQENSEVEIIGVVARNIEKTEKFANEWNIAKVYKSVEEMLMDKTIDCVYVASLHTTHALYSIAALEAGKHVLCEKPAALTVEQMEKVVQTAKKMNKTFMEAMTVGSNPTYLRIKDIIQSGEIGEVMYIDSSLGRMSKKEHKHSPEVAGGAIYDIGVYNIFLNLDLLGPTKDIQVLSKKHRVWDVIGTVQVISTYQDNKSSYSFMTMDGISTERAAIIGTKGTIQFKPSWTVTNAFEVHIDEQPIQYFETTLQNGWLCYELQAFVDLVNSGKLESETMPHRYSIAIQKEIAKIHEKIGFQLPENLINL